MEAPKPSSRRTRHGFTRTELLAIVAVLALLTGVTRPVWGNSGPVRRIGCLDNLRHLASAWQLYAGDYAGRLVRNGSGDGIAPDGRGLWVTGVLDWTDSASNTNRNHVTDPQYALLAPYAGSDASVFRCPVDAYVSAVQADRGWSHRVRSYSMNAFMGIDDPTHQIQADHEYYARLDQLRRLPPSRALVLIEEHPDSMNDAAFVTWMRAGATQWVDLPAAHHEGAAWSNFADGHVEQRRWETPGPTTPVTFAVGTLVPLEPADRDLAWLQARASEPR